MIRQIFQSLYFFLPAFLANGTPSIVARLSLLKKWNKPLADKIFGSHKTIRGIVKRDFRFFITGKSGALVGDLTKSALKRRRGISRGQCWFFPDKTDFVIGAIIGKIIGIREMFGSR